jgi:hypothetical protein
MSFTTRELKQLQNIVEIASALMAKAQEHVDAKAAEKAERQANKRVRRSGKELVKFRRDLKKCVMMACQWQNYLKPMVFPLHTSISFDFLIFIQSFS